MQFYRQNKFLTALLRKKSWLILLDQDNCLSKKERIVAGNANWLPKFPCQMLMVHLWEKEPNLRVMQASAHADLSLAIQEEAFCAEEKDFSISITDNVSENSKLWASVRVPSRKFSNNTCKMDY